MFVLKVNCDVCPQCKSLEICPECNSLEPHVCPQSKLRSVSSMQITQTTMFVLNINRSMFVLKENHDVCPQCKSRNLCHQCELLSVCPQYKSRCKLRCTARCLSSTFIMCHFFERAPFLSFFERAPCVSSNWITMFVLKANHNVFPQCKSLNVYPQYKSQYKSRRNAQSLSSS